MSRVPSTLITANSPDPLDLSEVVPSSLPNARMCGWVAPRGEDPGGLLPAHGNSTFNALPGIIGLVVGLTFWPEALATGVVVGIGGFAVHAHHGAPPCSMNASTALAGTSRRRPAWTDRSTPLAKQE